MTTANVSSESLDQVAAHWVLRMTTASCTPQDREAFERWLAESEAHGSAYQEQLATLSLIQGLACDPALQALREQTLQETAVAKNRWLPRLAACALVLILFLGVSSEQVSRLMHGDRGVAVAALPVVYTTAVGERRHVILSDGSALTLNTDSQVDVLYQRDQRHVVLARGQAWFDVAKSPDRPFVVSAGGRQVTAIGTSFDVQLQSEDRVKVVLIEGKVAVDTMASRSGRLATAPSSLPVTMVAGQQLLINADASSRLEPVDISSAKSWLQGRLVFNDLALTDVISDFNRYNRQKVLLEATQDWSDIRVSGVFDAGQVASFLSALASRYQLDVVPESTVIHVSRIDVPVK